MTKTKGLLTVDSYATSAACDENPSGAAERGSPQLIAPSRRPSGLWIDAINVLEELHERACGDGYLERIGREMIEVGFVVMPAVQDTDLVDRARRDYYEYIEQFADMAAKHRDEAGRQFRLTNFHIYSDAAMRLAKNEKVMRVLDFLFGREAAVHTSLTFQYSTMQALHRDSPYFHTFPEGLFFGVWTAMQDIDPESGPLSYVPASHSIKIDQWAIYNNELSKGLDPAAARRSALHIYQARLTELGEAFAARAYGLLKKGDVAIWHPQLIHGGSPATRPELKRHSMVTHCCPAGTYVFVEDAFLQHQEEYPPPPYYSFAESYGRKHADFTRPDFMSSI
jgi:ectoine hydroxylase-related dioxygenase (phytanoyl-CoA dioxygenase family)